MTELKLELVEENKTFLDHFIKGKVVGFYFLFLAIPVFFILPFYGKGAETWFVPFFIVLNSVLFISLVILSFSYNFRFDYDSVGNSPKAKVVSYARCVKSHQHYIV